MANNNIADIKPKFESLLTTNFVLLFGSLFMGMVSFSALLFILPIYLVSLESKEITAGIATGIFILSSIILRLAIGRYLDIYGCKTILLMSIGIYALSTFLFIWAANPLIVFLLRAMQGVGWGGFL